MTLDEIEEKLTKKLSAPGAFRYKALFDFEEDGKLFMDGSGDEFTTAREDREADVILTSTLETFGNILNGTQDPNIAFMMGKLKVKGSMGLALKLNSMLES